MDATNPYSAVRLVLDKFPTEESAKVCFPQAQPFPSIKCRVFRENLPLCNLMFDLCDEKITLQPKIFHAMKFFFKDEGSKTLIYLGRQTGKYQNFWRSLG